MNPPLYAAGRLLRLTSVDGEDHLVTDAEHCAGLERRTGNFFALCGSLVEAAPMVEPPCAICRVCLGVRRAMVVVAQASRDLQRGERKRHRRRGGLRSWLRRPFSAITFALT
jgi:hypothetical protein